MKVTWPIEIVGTGAYLPAAVITNEDIAKRGVDTSDEWIVQRTGIHQRRKLGPGEATLALALNASRAALADANVTTNDLDLIIVATVTPEQPLPATACLLQAALGCRWIPAYDLAAACSGFVYALNQAALYVLNDVARTVLVVGAESLTTVTDPLDRQTCILFGDAGGAAILRRSGDARAEFLAVSLGADGERGKLINIPAGGSREPASLRTVNERLHYMRIQGREVYKFAVTQMQAIIEETCADAGVSVADLTLIIPHQFNLRIIESACEKAGVSMEKVAVNIDRYGNSSSASVAVALDEARRTGRINRGDLVLLVAFGAGLTWGSTLLRL